MLEVINNKDRGFEVLKGTLVAFSNKGMRENEKESQQHPREMCVQPGVYFSLMPRIDPENCRTTRTTSSNP